MQERIRIQKVSPESSIILGPLFPSLDGSTLEQAGDGDQGGEQSEWGQKEDIGQNSRYAIPRRLSLFTNLTPPTGVSISQCATRHSTAAVRKWRIWRLAKRIGLLRFVPLFLSSLSLILPHYPPLVYLCLNMTNNNPNRYVQAAISK